MNAPVPDRRPPQEETIVHPTTPAAPDNRAPLERVEVPGFVLERELGRGGMGVVYQARQSNLNRTVALKMILAGGHAGSAEVARFLSEAEAVATFAHPNIVHVYEVGHAQGLPYMALEFVEGGTLADRLRAGAMSHRDAARLLEQVARGLNAAHQAGIVHRDLKPANILLTHDGTPKITDFGLAKRIEGGSGLTQTGAIVGTPSYMAPEQAAGENKRVGPSADVYALGAILYECLAGRPPFQAATPFETLLQVIHSEPAPPSRTNPKVARDLETICLKCLSKEPARRYSSAEAVANDLQRWQADEPIKARPVGRLERTLRWCRRNPMAAVAAGLLGLLLIAAVIVPVVTAANEAANARELAEEKRRTQEALEQSRANEQKATQAASQIATAERDKTEKLWQSYLDQAQARRATRLVGQRFESLKAITEAARIRPDLRLRNEAIACLALPDLQPASTPFAPSAMTHRAASLVPTAIDPVTKAVATLGDKPHTVLVRDRDGKLLHTLEHPLRVENLHWRRDGQYLAVAGVDCNVHIWRMPEGWRQCILEGHQSGIAIMEFTAQGGIFATWSYDGSSRLWDPVDGRPLLRSLDRVFLGPFGADDRQLHNGGQTLDFADGRQCRVLHQGTVGRGGYHSPSYQRGPWECAFSPDGRLLAAGMMGKVVLWDSTTGQQLGQVPTSTAGVTFGSDGSLWVAQEGAVTHWPMVHQGSQGGLRTFGPPKRIPLPGAFRATFSSSFALSRDGRTLVATDMATHGAWVIRTDRHELVRKLEQPNCVHAAVSPDGKLVVTSSWAWQPAIPMRVYDSESGRLLRTLTESPYARSAFAPDGELLVTGSQTAYTFWDVASWRPGPSLAWHSHLPGRLDFSADGRVLALISTNYLVRLVDPKTRQELATLTPPDPGLISGVRFSPDGTHLAVLTESNRIFLWDLRAIRHALRTMSLDWDSRPLPLPAGKVAPLRVRIREADQGTETKVTTLPAHPARQPATPEQVLTWLRLLSSTQANTAAQNLTAVGPPVLPALDRYEADAAPGVRELLRMIRARIDQDEAVRPRRITLKLENVPLKDAVAALAKESGLPLQLDLVTDDDHSLRFEDTPAWQALDELARRAKLRVLLTPGRLLLRSGEPVVAGQLAYPGPLRLQAAALIHSRAARLSDSFPVTAANQLAVYLTLAEPPRSRLLAIGYPRVEKALTDQGDRLTSVGAAATYMEPSQSTVGPRTRILALHLPPSAARKLTVEGVLPVEVAVQFRPQHDAALAEMKSGALFPLADGGWVRVVQAQPRVGGSALSLQLTTPDALNVSRWQAELTDEIGRTSRGVLYRNAIAPSRELWPGDLQVLANAGALPWPGFGWLAARDSLQTVSLTVTFPTPELPGPKSRLRLATFDRERVELPFAFRDLPLP